MSWSLSFIGTPDKIVAALDKKSAEMTDINSKAEFDAALPYLKGLVSLNYNKAVPPATSVTPTLALTAAGHAYTTPANTYSSVNATIAPFSGGTIL